MNMKYLLLKKKNQLILHDHRSWGPSPGLQSLWLNHALEKWELEGRGAAYPALCREHPQSSPAFAVQGH